MGNRLSEQQLPAISEAIDPGATAFELGMAYSSGAGGVPLDLVQAHRWLNVAAMCGHRPALAWRAEIAAEMSAREVVEAQRLARGTMARMANAA